MAYAGNNPKSPMTLNKCYIFQIDRKLGSIPLVSSIVKAVQGSMKVMLQSLLAQLRTPIQLPACLRVVGYLRRMDIFTETELR